MIIPLNSKRRLIGSQRQWTLQMLHKESSKRWRNYQYFTTLQTALQGAAEEEIRMAPTETMTEALKAVNQIVARYKTMLDDAVKEISSEKPTGKITIY